MAFFKNYDPGRIVIVIAGQQIQGIADGTFVKAARAEKSYKTRYGSAGDGVRIRNRNRSGIITLTLLNESPSNDYLSALVIADEAALGASASVGPSSITDLNGTSLARAAFSWVMQPSDLEYGDDSPNCTWEIECSELIIFNGGALV